MRKRETVKVVTKDEWETDTEDDFRLPDLIRKPSKYEDIAKAKFQLNVLTMKNIKEIIAYCQEDNGNSNAN